jgi:hypothetical protein
MRGVAYRAEERIRTVVAKRQGGRCRDCGAPLDARTAQLRQRPFRGSWEKPLDPPRARTHLFCDHCAKRS